MTGDQRIAEKRREALLIEDFSEMWNHQPVLVIHRCWLYQGRERHRWRRWALFPGLGTRRMGFWENPLPSSQEAGPSADAGWSQPSAARKRVAAITDLHPCTGEFFQNNMALP